MEPRSSAEQALADATEALFKVFGQYAKPPAESCIDTLGAPIPEAARAAWQKSLRDYTPDEVSDFGHHSLCLYVGSEGWREEYQLRFKYWLPRFLQHFDDKSSFGIVFEHWFIVQGFNYSGWPEWPEAEVAAIRRWIFAWLDACLTQFRYSHPSGAPVDHDFRRELFLQWGEGPIEFAIALGLDPTPRLYAATADLNLATARKLTLIVKSCVAEFIARRELENAEVPGVLLRRELLRWLLHPSTTERLEQAYFKFLEQDAGTAAETAAALDWLANLRTSYAKSPQGWPEWLAKEQERP
jgi:hypothetical protein